MSDPTTNPLPRSVDRGAPYELLDGEWRFELDLDDRGLQQQWYLDHVYAHTAHWPSTIEAHMAAAQDFQLRTPGAPDRVVAWYERDFTIREEWARARQ